MAEFFELMFPPFVACLILTGIHAYLGVHVIERGVIFVDLALAQIAALGSTVGFLFGLELHSQGGYFVALMFTLFGALVFAVTRRKQPVVPQEAIIGITYAVAAALSILILSRAPEGGEELKSLMVGHLLFIGWPEIVKIAAIYLIIGVIHFSFRKQFLLISTAPNEAYARGMNIRYWDFLFYATFGFVVTSSVEVAGVLLVFSFLVVPAVCGALLTRSMPRRIVIGWGIGLLASITGISLSYLFDLPTGATVVGVFGLAVPLTAVVRSRGRKL